MTNTFDNFDKCLCQLWQIMLTASHSKPIGSMLIYPTTHPPTHTSFWVRALSLLAFSQFPPCVSGAALFPIYWNQWQSYFSLPLSLLLALATLKFRCRCRFRISSCWSTIHPALLSCIANATRPQSIPGILFIPGRSPYLNKYWGCQVLQKMEKIWKSTSGLSLVKSKEGYKRRKRQLCACCDLKTNPFCPKSIFTFKHWHCINVSLTTFQANCCSIKTWKSGTNKVEIFWCIRKIKKGRL